MDALEGIIVLQIFKYLIAITGIAIGILYTILAIRYRGQACAIPKWVIAIMGFYWSFYYIQSILGGILASHQIWVRSPLFVTLMAILFMGWLSWWKIER